MSIVPGICRRMSVVVHKSSRGRDRRQSIRFDRGRRCVGDQEISIIPATAL